MDRPVIVVFAALRRRQKLMGDHCGRGVYQSRPYLTTLGATGVRLVVVNEFAEPFHLPPERI